MRLIATHIVRGDFLFNISSHDILKSHMKITSSHSSATESTDKVVKVLKKSGLVSKMSLGIIKKTKGKSGNMTIKFLPMTGGTKAIIVGGGVVQEIYIYTKQIEEVKKLFANL